MAVRQRSRLYGAGLVLAGTIFWSTAGLFVRMLHLDLWTILGWRSLFSGLSLLLVVLISERGSALKSFVGIGWLGLLAVPVSAVSMLAYIAALQLTSVANVMTVYATVPFLAAGIAFLWMGERMTPRVLQASAVALLGVVVMAGAATRPQDIAGNALALIMTATFAVMLVLARRHPSIGMAEVNALAALLCAAACWPLMSSGLPSSHDLLILALFGGTTTGIAYLLVLTGGRYIPSGEAGLIGLLEVILGPLWVWLAFAEQPSQAALIGGALVLAAVGWYMAGGLRGTKAEVPGPA